MNQIMQIAKEKNLSSLPAKDFGYSNHESTLDYGLEARDMIGLSWIFLDPTSSHLVNSKRRCSVIE